MKINIVRVDKSLPLPVFETKGAVAFDIISRLDTKIPPKALALIPSNNIVKVPEGTALILAPRSSMPKKTGLCFPHSIGIIDRDYCGDEDEIQIQVQNLTNKTVQVKRGDKIAQGMFVKTEQVEWHEVKTHNKKTRGGFGSTTKK